MKGRLRETELNRKRHRKWKIKKLREKYLKAESEEERKKIIEKALRVNPYITVEQFLKPIEGLLKK
ncbi:MAG: DUF6800 family protein [Candidatus Hydrothermales bacterium]